MPYSLHEGCALYIADGTAHLCDDKVQLFVFLVVTKHPPFYLVGNMGHYLNGLAEIVALALTVNNGLIDAACGDAVVPGGFDAGEPFVMTQVKIGLHAVGRHIAFTVFIGVQCSWVDVDVRVELLDGDTIATSLQQLTDTGRYDTFT